MFALCSKVQLQKWAFPAPGVKHNRRLANSLKVRINGIWNTTEKEIGHGYPVVDIKCFSRHRPNVLNTNLALININQDS